MKSFEFLDFSGGITDKDVPGYTNRYSRAVNLLIDHDKKLFSRDGFDIVSSTAYQLSAAERVARMVNFDIDSELLAFQNKKAFAITAGAWAEVTGPGGGSSASHMFNTNTAASLLVDTQWQHQLFMASNSGDPVAKMYRDSGGTMRMRSAGLPSFGTVDASGNAALTPTDGGLALAISLVNDLRTQMIAHYGANGATAGTPNNLSNGHHLADGGGLLAAQATAATASVAATNLSTLITLMNVLRTQYNLHISDAQKEDPGLSSGASYPSFRAYHAAPAAGGEAFYIYYDPATSTNQTAFQWRHFLNFSLTDPHNTIPATTTIANILVYVNDLRDKWNWHTFATNTHFNAMNWKGSTNVKFGTHKTALARVEPYTWAQITPNLGPFTQYVKDLYTEYNAHLQSGMHITLADSTNVVDSSFPTTPATFWDAVCLMGGIASAFCFHAMEMDPAFAGNTMLSLQGSVTSGSKNLVLAAGGRTTDALKNFFVIPIINLSTPDVWTIANDITLGPTLYFQGGGNYRIASSNNDPSNTTAVVGTNFQAAASSKYFLISSMRQHYGTNATQIFVPRDFCATFDTQDFTLSSAQSLQGFADMAKNLAGYLKAHELSRMAVNSATAFLPTKVKLNNYDYDIYYNTSNASTHTDGSGVYTHGSEDSVNYPRVTIFPNAALNGSLWPQSRFTLAPTAASFLYEACFRYDYTVGTKSFTNRSAPSFPITSIGFINEDVNESGSTELGKYAATLSNIYAFANAANENFAHTDTTNFRKEIYRTIGDGQLFYRVDVDGVAGDITNATTSFTDYSSDTFLPEQIELYTNDGSPENDRPPAATAVHSFNNSVYYVLGNLVYQSIPREPEAVPAEFVEEFDENILTVSSTRDVAVAFGKSKVYRLVGGFDGFGRGGLTYECIYDRTGTISAQSVVKADNGIFFAGKDGFYFTDGYQVMRVTDMEKTFRGYTLTTAQQNNIQGCYDNVSKRVYWTLQTGNGPNPDTIWCMDLQFGIKPDETPITTLSKTSGFNPTALAYYNGQLHYGDGDGYTFIQTRGRNIDLVKNTAVAATLWPAETVIWDIRSCNHAYGSQSIRKYFTRVAAQWDSQGTNVSAVIGSDADKGRIVNQLPVIRSRKLTDWGDSKIDWAASVYPAKPGSIVDEWRRFQGDGSLRSNFRALEFSTAYCVIVASKDMGTITLANTAGSLWSVTLTSLVATRKWPLYSVGYFVRINNVDYPVTVRTSDSAVTIDASGLTAPTAGVPASWELWGYPKNERIRFVGYTVDVDESDDKETASQGPTISAGKNP